MCTKPFPLCIKLEQSWYDVTYVLQLSVIMMSWVRVRVRVDLIVYKQIQRFLSYLQKLNKFFSKFILFPFSFMFFIKELFTILSQLKLNSSLRQIIAAIISSSNDKRKELNWEQSPISIVEKWHSKIIAKEKCTVS